MQSLTHHIESYEVHGDIDDDVQAFDTDDFIAATQRFTERVKVEKIRGGDVGRVRLIAVLATGDSQ